MISVDFRGLQVHAECGAEVLVFGALEDGLVLIDRVMVPGLTGLEMAIHYCRDYVDWHRPGPDRRDVNTLDVPASWQPRAAAPLLEPAEAVPEVVRAA